VLERRGLAGSEDEEEQPLAGSGSRNGGQAGTAHKSKSTSALTGARGNAGGREAGRPRGSLAAAAKAALRGVEPELFNPEELLSSGTGLGRCPWLLMYVHSPCLRRQYRCPSTFSAVYAGLAQSLPHSLPLHTHTRCCCCCIAGSDSDGGGFSGTARRPGLASIPVGTADPTGGKGSWFANWFAHSRAADDAASDPGLEDSALRRPPPVSPYW
jgi:hypothetical protein